MQQDDPASPIELNELSLCRRSKDSISFDFPGLMDRLESARDRGEGVI